MSTKPHIPFLHFLSPLTTVPFIVSLSQWEKDFTAPYLYNEGNCPTKCDFTPEIMQWSPSFKFSFFSSHVCPLKVGKSGAKIWRRTSTTGNPCRDFFHSICHRAGKQGLKRWNSKGGERPCIIWAAIPALWGGFITYINVMLQSPMLGLFYSWFLSQLAPTMHIRSWKQNSWEQQRMFRPQFSGVVTPLMDQFSSQIHSEQLLIPLTMLSVVTWA